MRPQLDASALTPAALAGMARFHPEVIAAAAHAIQAHEWVVIGMAQNPFVKKARKLLEAKNKTFHYIEHGSYLSQWKPRLSIKLWTGWPTFPQVFHNGKLIGGASELASYLG